MQNISKLKFMKVSMQLSVTYALDWKILAITYSDLLRTMVRGWSV